MEEQPDEDGQEDGLTLKPEVIPGAPGGGMEAGDGAADMPSPGAAGDGPPENGARTVWADAGTDAPEWWEEMPKAEGEEAGKDAPPAWEAPGPDGGADAAAHGPAGEGAQRPEAGRRPGAPNRQGTGEEQDAPSWREAGEGRRTLDWRKAGVLYGASKWAEGEVRQDAPLRREEDPPRWPPRGPGEAERRESAPEETAEPRRGLEELYRQTVQAARPALQAVNGERAVRMMKTEEAEKPRQLTVDELDRAVRRDSRRYDGGMSIF